MKLNRLNLEHVTASSLPNQNNLNAKVGIVHLGFGAFHRAHQALITDVVMKEFGGDWKIVGVNNWLAAGKSEPETGVEQEFSSQDNLYTVAVGQDEQVNLEVIGAVEEVLFSNQVEKILGYMTSETVKIVSLTITEKGYCHLPSTGHLDINNPLIQHDLQHIDQPHSAIGFLVSAIKTRKENGIAPFTPLTCDNLPENGHVLKSVVLDFALQLDPELAVWIKENINFPCSMVDRIVPQTTQDDINNISNQLGVEDGCCVTTEPFLQWVIEDKFNNDRPAWEKTSIANIMLTDDVIPFENMKLRLLNGTHSSIAYLGYLAGYQTVSETMSDPSFSAFIRYLMDKEISPSVDVKGIDLEAYKDQLIARYQNTALQHRTWQIAMDGSQKLPQRFLQTIVFDLEHGINISGLVLAVAAWVKYVSGKDENGDDIDVRDPLKATFNEIWRTHGDSTSELVSAFLSLDSVFSTELASNSTFKAQLIDALNQLIEHGSKQSVQQFIQTV
ncbi:mannitol dehydrogenase family protein [Vibrio algivorus]|uniref:Mannitol dehydrogenase family protein n=1 Tax=Vibrio algivorus TaxID=1667024 RepID=A0A557PF95_9VIBR|nr:mannitol dehydrogenase family protein [Vibrio algivorus]TVO39330.1 mannitol dehydrogenase family protein [Vibrio algivorus]